MNKKILSLIAAFSVTVIIIIVLIVATLSGGSSKPADNTIKEKEKTNIEEKEDNEAEKKEEEKKTDEDEVEVEEEKKDVITYKNTIETKEIKFETIVQEDPNSKVGTNKVLREGENGKKTTVKLITFTNGEETDSKVLEEYISIEPVNKIVLKGTLEGPIVVIKEETKTEVIKFETFEQDDPTLKKGKKVVKTEGVDGEKTIKYKVTYHDGKEKTREVVEEKITKEAVAKVILVGTKEEQTIGNSNLIFDDETTAIDWAKNEITNENSKWYDHNYSVLKIEQEDGSFKYSIQFVKKKQ